MRVLELGHTIEIIFIEMLAFDAPSIGGLWVSFEAFFLRDISLGSLEVIGLYLWD